MKMTAWMLLFLVLLNAPADAHSNRDKALCAEVKEKIRTIESKMRSGYTRAQGDGAQILHDAPERVLRMGVVLLRIERALAREAAEYENSRPIARNGRKTH